MTSALEADAAEEIRLALAVHPPGVIYDVSANDAVYRNDGPQAQMEDGAYAGYRPGDSAEAIAHLEALREWGAEYILISKTALWWLEDYGALGKHLSFCHQMAWEASTCVVFQFKAVSDVLRLPPIHRSVDGR